MLQSRRTYLKATTVLLVLLIFAGVISVPNLLWLRYSSTRIVVGHRGVASVMVRVDDQVIEIGNLRKGESRFLFLPKSSETILASTFAVSFMKDKFEISACLEDIELSMQHVDVVLYHDAKSTCIVSSPILSGLIVTKFF